jgi:hypothetical protein
MDGNMINGYAPFGHHLPKITEAEAVGKIPPHAKQDYRLIKMAAFEHHAPPERARGVFRTQLLIGLRQFP